MSQGNSQDISHFVLKTTYFTSGRFEQRSKLIEKKKESVCVRKEFKFFKADSDCNMTWKRTFRYYYGHCDVLWKRAMKSVYTEVLLTIIYTLPSPIMMRFVYIVRSSTFWSSTQGLLVELFPNARNGHDASSIDACFQQFRRSIHTSHRHK